MKHLKKNLQSIFKNITYKLFSIFHGKVVGKIDAKSHQNVKIHTVEKDKNIKYKIFQIQNARLYTDAVHDAAIIIKNSIVDGPSYQFRPINNASVEQNIVFKKGTPRKIKFFNGKVLSLLSGGAANDNYFHWIFDILPRIALCESAIDLRKIDFFLVPSLEKKFQRETLKFLNIPLEKCLSSKIYRHISASEIFVTDHPYVINNDAHMDIQKIPVWISKWLKKKYIMGDTILANNYNCPKKIYIDRGDSTANMKEARGILNEKEIKDFLEKNNFQSLQLGKFNFMDQVKIFNNADIIIGLHGAGFANLSFCRKDTKVIEFNNTSGQKMYENLSLTNQLNYRSINSAPIGDDTKNQYGHINVSIELLKKILEGFN